MFRRHDRGGRLVYCARRMQAAWKTQNDRYAGSPAHQRSTAKANAARVFIGNRYIGLASTPEEAAVLQREAKASFAAFRRQQREARWRFRETASKSG